VEQVNGSGEGQKPSKKAHVVEVEVGRERDDDGVVLGLVWC